MTPFFEGEGGGEEFIEFIDLGSGFGFKASGSGSGFGCLIYGSGLGFGVP